jgi:hypothetical protein
LKDCNSKPQAKIHSKFYKEWWGTISSAKMKMCSKLFRRCSWQSGMSSTHRARCESRPRAAAVLQKSQMRIDTANVAGRVMILLVIMMIRTATLTPIQVGAQHATDMDSGD